MSDEEKVTALTVVNNHGGELRRRERAQLHFTDEQQAMIRASYASGCTEQEFIVLMAIAKAKRLSPLLGQIHFVKRWTQDRGDVWATQTGIDGFRSIAEDTGVYDGQEGPDFTYDAAGKLATATVRVFRKDISRPFVGVAHFSEYVQTKSQKNGGGPTKMWNEKPHIMLAKCAEALAMRKAFPLDLGDIYTSDELPRDQEVEKLTTGVQPMGEQPKTQTQAVQTAEDWPAVIAACTTIVELDAVALRLKNEKAVHGKVREVIGAIYLKRQAELRASAQSERQPETAKCGECHLVGAHAESCSKFEPLVAADPVVEPVAEREPGQDDA